MSHHVDEATISKHVRTYMIVLVSLWALTAVTVAVSYLDVTVPVAVTLALFVATIKGSLVACYFMHLIDERKLIYLVLVLTVFFFVGLLLLPMWGALDQVMR